MEIRNNTELLKFIKCQTKALSIVTTAYELSKSFVFSQNACVECLDKLKGATHGLITQQTVLMNYKKLCRARRHSSLTPFSISIVRLSHVMILVSALDFIVDYSEKCFLKFLVMECKPNVTTMVGHKEFLERDSPPREFATHSHNLIYQ